MKKILTKKLVLEMDDDGNFVKGLVHYQMKVGGVLAPKIKTLGTTDWFEPNNLKKILNLAKQKIKDVEKST